MSKAQKLMFGEIDYSKIKPKGSVKEVIAKLSRGLMLPIAMLPIAGLFLGIGATIVNLTTKDGQITIAGLHMFGNILNISGGAIFSALPALFAIAIAISFTKDSGTAGLSAFVGWLIFNAVQYSLIVTKGDPTGSNITNADGYHFLWYQFMGTKGISQYNSIFTNNVGIPSLSTSVFGGIIVGFSVAFLYNKFKNIQLPSIIGFFSGVRFIPIVTFAFTLVLGLIISMIWPLIGLGLYMFGNALSVAPVGFNSFAFGLVERSLVPFGLHHAFYAPLWYTSAGGSFDLNSHVFYNGIDTGKTWTEIIWSTPPQTLPATDGDQNLWMFINNYLCKSYSFQTTAGDNITFTVNLNNWHEYYDPSGYAPNPGQYMQGKYPFMMFGLPAAALAMILVVPKGSENRKQAIAIIGSAALTSFLTGITEPLEFTFLFLAPWLFWGIHAPLAGVSFWLMNILHAHMGMTFSGGALDFIIYGLLPDATNHTANCYWAIIIGLALVPIYYLLFRTLILKFDIKTPGRGVAVKMFTKADFKTKTTNEPSIIEVAKAQSITNIHKHKGKYETLAEQIIAAYGGATNIKNVDACITKLRVQVANQSIVDKDKLIQLGARGVIKPSPQSVYAVFGNEADIIKNKMNEILFPGE
ncbi:MAG: PTS transporter subunit EIIC [Mycoplasmataceae bacterium]|nr:PTS transporter subunit EIIC [Mycoplasmataceae bacterium]